MDGHANREKSVPDGSDLVEKKDGEDASRNQSLAARRSSRRQSVASAAERARANINAKIANPLAEYSARELRQMGRQYAIEHGIAEPEDIRAFELGAVLAKRPEKYEALRKHEELAVTDEEIEVLRKEYTNRWSQPFTLYLVIVLCSLCAAVQGMGESPRLS